MKAVTIEFQPHLDVRSAVRKAIARTIDYGLPASYI